MVDSGEGQGKRHGSDQQESIARQIQIAKDKSLIMAQKLARAGRTEDVQVNESGASLVSSQLHVLEGVW